VGKYFPANTFVRVSRWKFVAACARPTAQQLDLQFDDILPAGLTMILPTM
jgi:hypothetical protein